MAILEENEKILRLYAFMDPLPGKRGWKFLAYHYNIRAALFWNFYSILIGVPMFVFIHAKNDIGLVYGAAGNILAMVEADVKILTLLLRKRRLAELIQTARNCSSGFECPSDEYTTGILSRAEKVCHFLSSTLVKVSIACYLPAMGLALYSTLANERNFVVKTITWYPFDVDTPFVFEFLVLYLLTILFHISIMALELVATISSMLIITVAQLQVLNHKLTNLRATAEDNVDRNLARANQRAGEILENTDEITVNEAARVRKTVQSETERSFLQILDNMAYIKEGLRKIWLEKRRKALVEADMQRLLQDCVDHHCEILRFVHEIQEMFNGVFSVVLLCNLTAIVLVSLYSSVRANASELGLHLSRILYLMIQLGLYCYLGDRVREESGKIGTSISHSDWLESSDSFKRSMRIVISMANQPIVIKAAGFVPLTLYTYRQVMRTSYSYYTVLSRFT